MSVIYRAVLSYPKLNEIMGEPTQPVLFAEDWQNGVRVASRVLLSNPLPVPSSWWKSKEPDNLGVEFHWYTTMDVSLSESAMVEISRRVSVVARAIIKDVYMGLGIATNFNSKKSLELIKRFKDEVILTMPYKEWTMDEETARLNIYYILEAMEEGYYET